MSRTIARFSVLLVAGLFASVCLLALSARGATQDYGTGQSKNETMSATGCLQRGVEKGGYFMTDGNRMWELSSKSVKLDAHVGHQVTVTGTQVQKSKSAEAKVAEEEKSEASGKDYADLNVKTLTMVSESCSGQ